MRMELDILHMLSIEMAQNSSFFWWLFERRLKNLLIFVSHGVSTKKVTENVCCLLSTNPETNVELIITLLTKRREMLFFLFLAYNTFLI